MARHLPKRIIVPLTCLVTGIGGCGWSQFDRVASLPPPHVLTSQESNHLLALDVEPAVLTIPGGGQGTLNVTSIMKSAVRPTSDQFERLDPGFQVSIQPHLVTASPIIYWRDWPGPDDGLPIPRTDVHPVTVTAPVVSRTTRVRLPVVASWRHVMVTLDFTDEDGVDHPESYALNRTYEVVTMAEIIILGPDGEMDDIVDLEAEAEPVPSYTPAGIGPAREHATFWDPDIARQRAFRFPGAGHFYTGETTKGAALLGGAIAAVGIGALLSTGEETYKHETHSFESPSKLPLVGGLVVAGGLWAYGILDAPKSANLQNEKNGLAIGPAFVRPQPILSLAREGEPALGMQLWVTW